MKNILSILFVLFFLSGCEKPFRLSIDTDVREGKIVTQSLINSLAGDYINPERQDFEELSFGHNLSFSAKLHKPVGMQGLSTACKLKQSGKIESIIERYPKYLKSHAIYAKHGVFVSINKVELDPSSTDKPECLQLAKDMSKQTLVQIFVELVSPNHIRLHTEGLEIENGLRGHQTFDENFFRKSSIELERAIDEYHP